MADKTGNNAFTRYLSQGHWNGSCLLIKIDHENLKPTVTLCTKFQLFQGYFNHEYNYIKLTSMA